MKLFTKYNRVNLLTTVIIFIFSSIAFYFFFRFILVSEVDEDLKIEKREIETYVQKTSQLPDAISVNDLRIQYRLVSQSYVKTSFRTFIAYDSLEKENGNFREMIFGIRASGEEYKISVVKSLEATDDLLRSVLIILIPAILLMLMASYIINRIVLKRLWKPFYDTLHRLKYFSLGKNRPLHLQATNVEEFTLLNNTLETTTAKAQQDYLALKEFTENASHEMQTPLAIIGSKLDLLIQDEHLSETQSIAMQTVYESIQKLNHLNQSLLLLAKIGNRQFEEITTIHLNKKIQEKTEAFQELWANKNITINVSLKEAAVKMNAALADILLNNLLSNATKHNSRDGMIRISLTENSLTISNTSSGAALDTTLLFTRFYTPNEDAGHNGLGLSIIKQICDASGFSIVYSYQASLHSFTLTWQWNR
jgi:signal transduction histidine kinase